VNQFYLDQSKRHWESQSIMMNLLSDPGANFSFTPPPTPTPTPASQPPPITTDDLIPLLAFVVIRAAPKNIVTYLFYMENFVFSQVGKTSLGFAAVSFR
jgi:hypothetical protein